MHALALLLALSCWSSAETMPAPGYVIRSEADKVYVDYGESSGVKPGDLVVVYKEGEELRHPVTKALLGRVETELGAGIIREVHPKFSIAEWTRKPEAAMPQVARTRLKPAPQSSSAAPAQPSAPVPAAAPPVVPVPPSPSSGPQPEARDASEDDADGGFSTRAKTRAARWHSPVFDYKATGMAIADFDGDGLLDLALAEDSEIHLYPYPPATAKSKGDFKVPGITPHVMSLEAGDLNGNGKAELFITLFNAGFPRMETSVIEVQAGSHWVETANIPWIVRSHQGAKGQKLLAVQRLLDNQTFPFSSILPLEYKDGKYGPGKPALKLKRVDWIYDFTLLDLDGAGTVPAYHMSTDRLRVDLKKGSWKSSEPYSQTPNRLTWKERILQCRPSVLVRSDENGSPALYAVRNIARFGGLAQTFGLYARAELHYKKWNGMAFDTAWKADLSGFSPAQTWVPNSGQPPRELAVTVVASTGKSAVWTYDP